jgi:hypothetical protein
MSIKHIRRAAALAAFALATAVPGATAQVPTGTVLHYVKTNLDGTRPEQIVLYVASADSIEVYKYHPASPPAGLVTARFDWAHGGLVALHSVQRRSATETREVARFDYDPVHRTGTVHMLGEVMPVTFTHQTFGVYAFELSDLNMLLARTEPSAYPRDLMLVDLAYSDPKPNLYERGHVELRPEGEETRAGTAVRRYTLSGPGLGGQTATLWIDRSHGWIQEIESPVSNHPDWSSYRLRLERVETMTPEQWLAFQVAAIAGG